MTNEMKYIYEIYRQQSFSKAAEKLFITQPALSLAVQRVETELGTPLFDRTHKPVRLTPAGELYIRAVREIAGIEDNLSTEIYDLVHLKSGKLVLGGTQYLSSYVFPPVVSYFALKYPAIHIEIVEDSSQQVLDALLEGKVDLTYSCSNLPADKFSTSFAFQDKILLAVPRQFVGIEALPFALSGNEIITNSGIAAARSPVPLSLFANTPFILLRPENNLYERSMQFFADAGFSPRISLVTNQLVTAYRMCCSGLGATFVSTFLLSGLNFQKLLFFKVDSPLAVRNFNLVTNCRCYTSNAMRAFIETFSEVYPSGHAPR